MLECRQALHEGPSLHLLDDRLGCTVSFGLKEKAERLPRNLASLSGGAQAGEVREW